MHLFSQKTIKPLLLAAGLWIGIRFLLPIGMPFLLALALARIAEPLIHSLNLHLRLPRRAACGLGITLSLFLTVFLFLTLCALLIRELGALADILPDLESSTVSGLAALENWLLSLVSKTPAGIRSLLIQAVEGIFTGGNALLDSLSSELLSLAGSLLRAVPDSALSLGTWVLACFMISTRLPRIRAWVRSHLPPDRHQQYTAYLRTLKKTLCGWLLAQAKLAGITLAILCAGFFLLQIDHPVLWAVITALVDILPILGTGTVLIPWSVICLLQGNTLRAVGLLGIYTLIAVLRSVLEPRFVGRELGLDPLVTLIAIYTGYRLWGMAGMLLAPVLAVVAVQMLRQSKNCF